MQKSVTLQKHLKIFPIWFKDYKFATWRRIRILLKSELYLTAVKKHVIKYCEKVGKKTYFGLLKIQEKF